MTISLEEMTARMLADPEVEREYDALGPEFEALTQSLKAKLSQAIDSPGSRSIVESNSDLEPER